ncbi:MAG: V-type ATP synthase subunit E [Spirochaetota bacterium]|nr:V-type ATP synthase subunit E [Spirochaetota bacterium]
MSLEDIKKKILFDAEQKKSELLEAAKQQSSIILTQAKHLAKNYTQEHEKSSLSKAVNLERGLVIDARRKLANEILARKRVRIEQTFTKAKAEFISSSSYAEVMKSLILKSITSKKEEVILGQNENVLDQKWLDSINQVSGGSLVFSKEKGDFVGGVMLKEEDTSINITIDTLFSLLCESAEKPIADILFRG